jgi:pyruvate dehydrogenase E1 component alpha subunit
MPTPYDKSNPMGPDDHENWKDLESVLRPLLRIREFETALLDLFSSGELNGTTHTCLGQEHVPVAVMPLLEDDDFVFSNHRGHGHYLARFADYEGLLAEIMGRETGVCRGVGGSQHIRRGRYFSTGVQGESVPIAAGCAWQMKRDGGDTLSLAFIGDGTWGQGAVYEALNMAALWKLPIVIVVENNSIAQSTPTEDNLAGTIKDRVQAVGIDFLRLETVDVIELRTAVSTALDRVRKDRLPLVIEICVGRLGPHSKGDDSRSEAELALLKDTGWEAHYRGVNPQLFDDIANHSHSFIANLVERVKQDPISTWESP